MRSTAANKKHIAAEIRRLEREITEIKRRCMLLWTEIEEKKKNLQLELDKNKNNRAAPSGGSTSKETNLAADREREQIMKARVAHLQSTVDSASQPYWPSTPPPPYHLQICGRPRESAIRYMVSHVSLGMVVERKRVSSTDLT